MNQNIYPKSPGKKDFEKKKYNYLQQLFQISFMELTSLFII